MLGWSRPAGNAMKPILRREGYRRPRDFGAPESRTMQAPPTMIASSAALESACGMLAGEEFVVVDTEFIRETTFKPILCLVQIAGASDAAEPVLVDALAEGIDLEPLYGLLTDRRLLKVMHAGVNDTEVFGMVAGVAPEPVFDTQIAGEFCGFGDQPAYGSLVRSLAGARIDKSVQYTDWSRRPLSPEQMDYAADDIRYLPAIYRALRKRLDRQRRADWAREETERRYRRVVEHERPRSAWRRLSVKSDDRRHLAVLRELAAWREEEAIRRDIPRQHVMKNQLLLRVARLQPRDCQALMRIPSLKGEGDRRERKRQGILEAVRRGLDCPPEERPESTAEAKVGAGEVALIRLLDVVLAGLAADEDLAPRIVASQGDLRRLVMEEAPDIPLLDGWRWRLCGETLLRLRDGELGLRIEKGRLRPILLGVEGAA